jgi:hypothetical protein
MAALDQIAARLKEFYPDFALEGDVISFPTPDERRPRANLRISDTDISDHESYQHARRKSFDERTHAFVMNCSVEMPLITLHTDFFRDSEYTFTDRLGNTVRVRRATRHFQYALFYSSLYESFAKRRLEHRRSPYLALGQLVPQPYTATYTAKGRKAPANLIEVARQKVRSCLVKLAIEHNACFAELKPHLRAPLRVPEREPDDWSIPNCEYDENVAGYYKLARTSPFASQSFLAYYNVLEYFFSRVAEERLHKRLASVINATSFRAHIDGLDKIISIVRGEEAKRQEMELLRGVVESYVTDDEMISFIKEFEDQYGKGFYTKAKPIFGETMRIDNSHGSVIPNTARLLKHVRNAIVHSTDVYDRAERHLPFSESESMIADYIPIVRFLAERVLFGTAQAR